MKSILATGDHNLLGYAAAVGGVTLTTSIFALVFTKVSPTGIAPCYLLVVLIAASIGGLGPGVFASITGVLCFDCFFLPEIHKFVVQSPENIVEFFVFLV